MNISFSVLSPLVIGHASQTPSFAPGVDEAVGGRELILRGSTDYVVLACLSADSPLRATRSGSRRHS